MGEERGESDRTLPRGSWILPALLPLMVLIAWMVAGYQEPLYSPASGIRRGSLAYYQKYLGPRTSPPIATNLLDKLTFTRSEDALKVSGIPSVAERPWPLDIEVVRIPPGGGYAMESGEMKLVAQGIAYGPYPEGSRSSEVELSGHHFSPEGRELTEEEVLKLLEDPYVIGFRNLSFKGHFPRVRFIFQPPEGTEILLHRAQAFDPRTKVLRSGSTAYGVVGGKPVVDLETGHWQDAPTEVALDIAHGPVEEIEIPMQVGEVIRRGSWEMHLVAVEKGQGRASRNGDDSATLRFDRGTHRRHTQLLFVVAPWYYHLPVEIEAVNHSGQRLYVENKAGGRGFLTATADGFPEDIQALRVRYYPHVRRLVYEIPGLFGMPEENRGIENLFDLHLPVIRVANRSDFERCILRLVQLGSQQSSPATAFPTGYFPKHFTNTTPRELLAEYMRHATNRGPSRAEIDLNSHQLVYRPTLGNRFLQLSDRLRE